MSLVAPRNEFVVRNVVEGGLLGSRGFPVLPVWRVSDNRGPLFRTPR